MLVATGGAAILDRFTEQRALLRTIACVVVVGVLAARFVTIAPDVVGLPREAHRDAAEVIQQTQPSTRVLAYMRNPHDLAFYLGRSVEDLDGRDVAAIVCSEEIPVYYVMQTFALEDVSVPCLTRAGVRHERFRQYTRGEMNVWFIPPG
jgi:hypothetical protein